MPSSRTAPVCRVDRGDGVTDCSPVNSSPLDLFVLFEESMLHFKVCHGTVFAVQ